MNDQPITQISKAQDLEPIPSTAAKIWNMVSLLLTIAGIGLMGVGGFMYLAQMIEASKPPPARIIEVTVDPNPISTATILPSPTLTAVSVAAVDTPERQPTLSNRLADSLPTEAQADVIIEPSPAATEAESEPALPTATATLPATDTPTTDSALLSDEALSLADNPLVVVEDEAAPPVEAAVEVPAPVAPDEVPPAPATPSTTDGIRLNRIVAESIGLDAEVVEVGWTPVVENGVTSNVWVVADYAAGWHKNSALPGQGGNVVLSGHHNIKGEIFRYIVDIEPGATITLYDQEGHVFNYFVEDKFIVKDKGEPEAVRRENAKWIGPFNEERLTLVTCWPYSNNTHRVIVIAKPLVSEPQVGG
ncbi:MAG: sortase [Anaerolineae bacterium]|nr:sortase [Anaerolineae bacterium]